MPCAYGISLVSMLVASQLTHLLTTKHMTFSPHVYALALQHGFFRLEIIALVILIPGFLLSGKEEH